MSVPQFKVNVTHGGVATDYVNDVFSQIQVKKRENNYDVATLWFADAESRYYEDAFSKFDEIKIYFKDASETTPTQVFGGHIRQIIPTMNQIGLLPQLICKGYGVALEATHCNRDYGVESANPAYPRAWNIWKNVIYDFVNNSFGADPLEPTGWGITGWHIDYHKYVTDYYDAVIKYINNPYRTNLEVVNLVCELTSAIGAGTDAGAHWIVDHSKRFLVGQIGNHGAGGDSPLAYWPDWWNPDPGEDEETSRVLSTLEQGVDFTDYVLSDKSEEFANKVVLITDFRRPAYDYWTENNANLWGATGSLTKEAQEDIKVVGTHAIHAEVNTGNLGYLYYPLGKDAKWNMTKWGSIKTIPTLNYYMQKNSNLNTALSQVQLFTTDINTNYFYFTFGEWTEGIDEWRYKSIPVGPYWANNEETKQFRWTKVGVDDDDWENIKGICFKLIAGEGGPAHLYLDDLHFNGKIARSAKDSTSIDTLNMEFQKVLISRNAMDDTCEPCTCDLVPCTCGSDTGFAARIALAELLRRRALPKTITFSTTRDMKAAMAGQKLRVHACKKADGTFRINTDMRILELQADLAVPGGMLYTVTATTDLLNSTPISVPDQYAMWQENMFLNSKEAKNIRSGAEVDLLIDIIEKDYGT